MKVYVDGKPQKLRVLLDELNQSFATKQPFRIGAGGGPANRFHGLVSDVRVYGRVLTEEDVSVVSTPESITELAAMPAAQRTAHQQT